MRNRLTIGLSYAWLWGPAVLCCAVMVVGLVIPSSASRAQTTREELLNRQPLAECKVQQKTTVAEPEQAEVNVVAMRSTTSAAETLKFYTRGQNGQWIIPAEVNRDDPWIRVLVMGPAAPMVIDLAVYIDGRAFRDLREQWVDSLVEQATVDPEVEVDQSDGSEAQEPSVVDAPEATAIDTEDNDAPVGVKVRSRQAPTAVERLRHYLAAGVAATDREEVRWLVAEWAGGPGLLTLGPAVSWKRADIAPLWSWLDTDQDRDLSAAEIKGASARLRQADTDEDDIVDIDEIQLLKSGYSPYPRSMSHPLVIVLNEQTHWGVLRREIVNLYGKQANDTSKENQLIARIAQGDKSLTAKDLTGLLLESPEMVCRIDLGSDDGKVALLATDNASTGSDQAVWSSEQVITAECGGTYIEFSALDVSPDEKAQGNQIAVGAVIDGYPLFRLLDQDNNRRLTLRECRQLEDCLAGLDLDDDRQISGVEIPTAIRLTVTRGLLAHESLAQAIASSKEINARDRTAIPSWFVDMDRNADGDLSRREFLGNSEQFNRLDQDGDGLINTKEAQD